MKYNGHALTVSDNQQGDDEYGGNKSNENSSVISIRIINFYQQGNSRYDFCGHQNRIHIKENHALT